MSVGDVKAEPCPFCGKGIALEHISYDNCFAVRCLYCGYVSAHTASERGAVENHNKICRFGNAAKMREACANIAEYAKAAKCHTEDAHTLGFLDQIELWAKAALAAPARNCDMYQDGQSAYNGWRDSFRDKRSPELLFSDWIFETAKEKTDGSK